MRPTKSRDAQDGSEMKVLTGGDWKDPEAVQRFGRQFEVKAVIRLRKN